MQKNIAEFLGTFTLALVVGLSLSMNFPVVTPILAALVLGTFVYTVGHISGTNINPKQAQPR
jgi:glycerol uptake facilitator-like aquaporin